MSRFAILLAFVAGCSSPASQDLRPVVAVAGKYSLMEPTPPPAPAGEKCRNCRGTGRVGDGVVSTTCTRCDGTGKEPKSVMVSPPTCKDGKCQTPSTAR